MKIEERKIKVWIYDNLEFFSESEYENYKYQKYIKEEREKFLNDVLSEMNKENIRFYVDNETFNVETEKLIIEVFYNLKNDTIWLEPEGDLYKYISKEELKKIEEELLIKYNFKANIPFSYYEDGV